MTMTTGHEDRGDLVDKLLDGRFRALGLLDHAGHAAEGRLLAHSGRLDVDDAVLVDRAADDVVAGLPLDRDRLAGEHRLVDGCLAVAHDAVDRPPAGRGERRRRRRAPAASTGISISAPSRTTVAVFAARPSSARMALDAAPFDDFLEVLAHGDEDEHRRRDVEEHRVVLLG